MKKKINKLVCMLNYEDLMSNYQIKTRHKDMLAVLVKEAKGVFGFSHEAERHGSVPFPEPVLVFRSPKEREPTHSRERHIP